MKLNPPALRLLGLVFLILPVISDGGPSPEQQYHRNFNRSSAAILVFGDSTVDPGNNNFIDTLFRSNFPPYGRDFVTHNPTGRFTNGRLATDYIASYAGIKEFIPPYLDPNLEMEELLSGVSFASAGSGFDPLTSTISGLWAEGGRRIVLVGLPPMGCLPAVITLNSDDAVLRRGCVESYSSAARGFNEILQKELVSMQSNLAESGAKFYYVDSYGPLADMIHDHRKYGFEEVGSGCCGSGYVEASFLCNPKTYTCPDVTKYVFWDSIHPTDKVYYNLFLAARPVVDAILKF
ncbi:GDSL esterase/lipase At5g45960 isoform X1 [Momordica charantia]|uniref:GDSL esterase/lipase At5g45960 isoform X1 n=1 Tax=Momordica charantia TaxID=3673 RepID=A0A6J1CLP5_MOMCH|nr:GDSL esterase/lipase At5g45960 isoform X1 [Momordica charantia]